MAFHVDQPEADISKSPALTNRMTQPGMILGTAACMSPEQSKGKSIDKKTDIWAFGCVLYECLAGKPAFAAETVSETIASILKGEPDWSALPSSTPLKVRDLLRQSLNKNTKDRIHDIADARIEMADALSEPSPWRSAAANKAHRVWAGLALLFMILAVGIGAFIVAWWLKPSPSMSKMQFTIDLPAGIQLTRGPLGLVRCELALSSDGKHLVFSGSPDGSETKAMLYLRSKDSPQARPIASTDGGRTPFFSPDSQWVGFWAHEKLRKVSLAGGIPIPLCDWNKIPMGESWSRNGMITIGTENGGFQTVNEAGGKLDRVTTPDPLKEATHRLPSFVDRGTAIFFTVMPHLHGNLSQVEVLSLQSGKRKLILENGADARLTPTGPLIFAREGTLLGVPFDSDRLEAYGSEVPVVNDVMQAIGETSSALNSGAGQFSFLIQDLLSTFPEVSFLIPTMNWSGLTAMAKLSHWYLLAKKRSTYLGSLRIGARSFSAHSERRQMCGFMILSVPHT